MKSLKINKRGQLGLDVVQKVFVAFLVLSVIGVAVILALVSLGDSGIFPAGSQGANMTSQIINNVSSAQSGFFGSTGTIYAILVVVVIILAIAIIVGVVSRFGGGTSRL